MEKLLENDLTGSIGTQNYLCSLTWRNGTLLMDEPQSVGGNDLGPDPYTTLLASLAGCTLSTLRMYINRKGWEIPEIHIALNLSQQRNESIETTFTRNISFSSEVSQEQKEHLLRIAEKCPVSLILKNKILINTQL
jgi:putative redox protein